MRLKPTEATLIYEGTKKISRKKFLISIKLERHFNLFLFVIVTGDDLYTLYTILSDNSPIL